MFLNTFQDRLPDGHVIEWVIQVVFIPDYWLRFGCYSWIWLDDIPISHWVVPKQLHIQIIMVIIANIVYHRSRCILTLVTMSCIMSSCLKTLSLLWLRLTTLHMKKGSKPAFPFQILQDSYKSRKIVRGKVHILLYDNLKQIKTDIDSGVSIIQSPR